MMRYSAKKGVPKRFSYVRKPFGNASFYAEREALEPTYSKNIIKLQITDNHIQSGVHSKSKFF